MTISLSLYSPPWIPQLSQYDDPFGLTGRGSIEKIKEALSAPALNRQSRYEEEKTRAAFWIKKMADDLPLPEGTPNVQTLLHSWKEAYDFMQYARIFEDKYDTEVAESYILPGTEGQDAQPEEVEEPAEVPRVHWDRQAEVWRCPVFHCGGWDRNKAALTQHLAFHPEQDFAVRQAFDQNRGVTLYERYLEMKRERESVEFKAGGLPQAHNKYFWCRVEQAKIVGDYDYDVAMGKPTGDVILMSRLTRRDQKLESRAPSIL